MMAVIKYTSKERDLLARLMRAEAIGEGDLGMLMVGNVGVNRVLANCLTFKNIRTITNMIYQDPGGFSGKDSPLFFSNPSTAIQRLADRVIKGEYYHPATHALCFMLQKRVKHADKHGGNKNYLEDIKGTVFIDQMKMFAQN